MTEREAIEELREQIATCEAMISFIMDNEPDRNTGTLEKKIGAAKSAISALEKHIPKKPEIKPDKYSDLVQHYYCPDCGRYFGQRGIHNVILFGKERYCQGEECGQAIDWSE